MKNNPFKNSTYRTIKTPQIDGVDRPYTLEFQMFATANCEKNTGPAYNVFLMIKAIFIVCINRLRNQNASCFILVEYKKQ
jgi:hypothetical protein